MKKLFCCLIAVLLAFSLVCLVGCNEPVELNGEYRYKLWDNEFYYGVKVTVVMQKNKIQQVIVHDETETLINILSKNEEKYWPNESVDFLQQFVGKTAAEIGEIKVVCSYKGEPREIEGMEYLEEILHPCAHVILAVQDALDVVNAQFPTDSVVYNGECVYENRYVSGTYYGVKVAVTVLDGYVVDVQITSQDTEEYTNLSANWTVDFTTTGEPTEGKKAWLNSSESFLQRFVGESVVSVMAIRVERDSFSGNPESVSAGYYVTGATQSSGRVILAIQDALSKIPA